MNRRQSLKLLSGAIAAGAAAGSMGGPLSSFAQSSPKQFTLPPLGYAVSALEPHIDARTMELHHGKHHQTYVDKLNEQVAKYPDLATKPLDAILLDVDSVPEGVRKAVRNNGGGHWNHSFFWDLMTPGGAKEPTGELQAAINQSFGSQSKMVEAFNDAAEDRFGAGWAWLTIGPDKKLIVTSTPNQDTPHMIGAKGAILGMDVWEHAYYLKYNNRREEYATAWWNTVNWEKAAGHFRQLVS